MADDLLDWSLGWARYVREHGPVTRPVAARLSEPESAPVDEECDDERDADAAVGVMPVPLLVYGATGGNA